jgi:hypothetical protein
MSSTLGVRSVVASAFCVLDRYTSERFGRLRSTRGEGASGVSPEYYGVRCGCGDKYKYKGVTQLRIKQWSGHTYMDISPPA